MEEEKQYKDVIYPCINCIHQGVCVNERATAIVNRCVADFFLDKSRIIELPIKVTDSLKEELTIHCYERCVDEL